MSVLNYDVIPSRDERDYLQEIGYELSDRQKATIVYHSVKDVDTLSDDDRTLLTYASDLVAGCGSLDFFLHAYDEYHGRRERA